MAKKYLRLLNSVSVWADFSDSFDEKNFDCPPEIMREILDPRGWSVFEVQDKNDEKRVVAALALVNTIKEAHYLIIEHDLFSEIGLQVEPSPDKAYVFDKIVKKKHYDVKGMTYGKLKDFAMALATKAIPNAIPSREIVAYLNGEIGANRIIRKDVFRESDNPRTGYLMARHWEMGFLELTHP